MMKMGSYFLKMIPMTKSKFTISTKIYYSQSIPLQSNRFPINQIIGISSLLLVMVISFFAYFIVSRFEKIVNEKLISVFSSIIAIILAGLSVQYVLDGINEDLV